MILVMDTFSASEYVSVAITLVFLTIAAISDLKTREVPDKVWLAFGPIGLALTIYRTFVDPSVLLFTGVSVGLSILVAFGLVFFGLAGGADAKALMCLGLTLPLPPGSCESITGLCAPVLPNRCAGHRLCLFYFGRVLDVRKEFDLIGTLEIEDV